MESYPSQKSRRRFLADMLFLGGGLTAAAILGKNHLPAYRPESPAVAGEMVAPVLTDSPTPSVDQNSEPIPMEPPSAQHTPMKRDPMARQPSDCQVKPPKRSQEIPIASKPIEKGKRPPSIMGMMPERRIDP